MKPSFASLAALVLATATSAFAAPVTLNVSGVVTYNYVNGGLTGQAANASLTLDTSTFQYNNSDGMSFDYQYGYFYNSGYCNTCVGQQSNPPQVTGHYSDGVLQTSVGGGTAYDFGQIAIYRNYGGYGLNEVVWYGYSYDTDGHQYGIEILTYDYLGTATQMFQDANGGVDLGQGVNWLAAGSTSIFWAWEYDTTNGYSIYQNGNLNMAFLSNAVPEPTSLVLAAAALLGAGLASSRRRNIAG